MTQTASASGSMTSGVRALVGAEVLIIDKDERVRTGMTQLLSAGKLHVTAVDDPSAAWELINRKFFSVIVVDLDTPHPNAGLEVAEGIGVASPTSMVIMLTPRRSFDDGVLAIRAGAVDLILKSPGSVEYLRERVMVAAGRSVDKREIGSILVDVKDTHEMFLKKFMELDRALLNAEDELAGRKQNNKLKDVVRVLVVCADESLGLTLAEITPDTFDFENALSGGQALDRCSTSHFHMVMVGGQLHDLPASLVVQSVKTQNPDMLVLAFTGPGEGGKIEIVESTRNIPVLNHFTEAKQLVGRLDELAEAVRVKMRERRYTQAFRERHYDFLRRFVTLKAKIDRAMGS